MKNIIVTGRITYVVYNKETFYICKLADGTTVKGHILDNMSGDIKGLTYEFKGNWVTDRYGRSFKFSEATMQTHELLFFLTGVVKGIGEATATLMLDRFEDELENILDNNPDKLREIPGVGEKRLKKIVESWNNYSHLRKISKFFGKYGVSGELVTKIYNKFKDDTVLLVENNPYIIAQIQGISFLTADRIARKMEIPKESENRIKACAVHILEYQAFNEGHTFVTIDSLLKNMIEYLDLDISDQYSYLMEILEKSILFKIRDDIIGLTDLKNYENVIYNFVKERSNIKNNFFDDDQIYRFIEAYEKNNNIVLSDCQVQAVLGAVNTKVFVLSGYAGTGKTTVSRIILSILSHIYEGRIVGCAMSGIAARRLEDVTGFPSFTIHSLLGFDGSDFCYNKFNKLDYSVIIVDEAGMVNSELFYSLITATPDNAIFIMVGDDAQLPPIGSGNVFSDIIKNNIVPFVKLEEVFRQSEDSVVNMFANIIRHGEIPRGYEKTHSDWYFKTINIEDYYENKMEYGVSYARDLRKENNVQILKKLLGIVASYKRKGIGNILTDVQILAPMRKGILGTENLNIELQKILNPAEYVSEEDKIERNGKHFMVGDKVVHLINKDKNVYSPDLEEFELVLDNSKIERIFNGTIGIIKYIDKERQKVFVYTLTDVIVEYDIVELNDVLDLAYALTVHKAQGSEYERVIMPLTKTHYIMLDNQWMYTAVTRAKRGLVLVGEEQAFESACTNQTKKIRNTWLPLIHKDCSEEYE